MARVTIGPMVTSLQVTPLLGLPHASGWSHVLVAQNGNGVWAYTVTGAGAGNVGRDIQDELQQVVPKTTQAVYDYLNAAVTYAEDRACTLEIATAWCLGEKLIIGARNARVALKRGATVKTPIQAEAQSQIREGQIPVDGDLILLTHAASAFEGEIFQKIHHGYEIDTIAASIVPAAHSQTQDQVAAIAFVSFVSHEANLLPAKESPLLLDVEINLEPTGSLTKQTYVQESLLPESNRFHSDPSSELEALAEEGSDEEMISLSESSSTEVVPNAHFVSSVEVKKTSYQLSNFGLQKIVKLGQKVQALGSKSGRLVWSGLVGTFARLNRFNPGEIYVKPKQNRRMLIMVLFGLLIFFLIFAGGFWWQNQRKLQKEQAQQEMAPVLSQIAEAQARFESEPFQSREQLRNAMQQLDALLPRYEKKPVGKSVIQHQIAATQAILEQLSGREELQTLPVFLDLGEIETGFVASLADSDGTQAVLVDAQNQEVMTLDLQNKTTKKIAIPATFRAIAFQTQYLYFLGGGINRVLLNEEAKVESVKEEGDSDRDARLIARFSEYTYVLNTAKRAIYRYAPEGNGVSDPVAWLKPPVSFELGDIQSWAIDSDMWLGMKNGQVFKLSSGRQEQFEIKGLVEPFDSPVTVVTKENYKNIYVLEPAKRRVVVLSKQGEFIKEVRSVSLGAATTLLVDEPSGLIIPVGGSLLFQITL